MRDDTKARSIPTIDDLTDIKHPATRIKYKGWKDPDKAIANVRDALFRNIQGLEELLTDSLVNKARAIELINAKITAEDGRKIINQYLKSIGVNSAIIKNHCSIFEGSAYQVIAKGLHEFQIDLVYDLGGSFTGWKNPEKAIANMRHALFHDIPELETLLKNQLNNPKENREKAIALIKQKIEEAGSDISCYHAKLKTYSYHQAHNFSDAYEAITKSLHEFRINPVLDLGARYKGWKKPEKAKANVRHALFHDILELEELIAQFDENPEGNKSKAAELIRKKIEENEKSLHKYMLGIGLGTSGSEKDCPIFKGSCYTAVIESLPEFDFDRVIDLGGNYRTWLDSEKAIANMRHALFHDIPELEELAKDPENNKAKAAELIKKRIEDASGITEYHGKLKTHSSFKIKQCTVFEGNMYAPFFMSLHEFGLTYEDLTVKPPLERQISNYSTVIQERLREGISINELSDILLENTSIPPRMRKTISSSPNTVAVILSPEMIERYIDVRKISLISGIYTQELKELVGIPRGFAGTINSLDKLNVIKLAQNTNGEYLSQEEYFRFIRDIFGSRRFLDSIGSCDNIGFDADERLIEENRTDKVSELSDYIANGNLSKVSIIEEKASKSKNPNYRIRMFLSTNHDVETNATLEAFVKFYSRNQRASRDFDLSINNYLIDAGIECIGIAHAIKLHNGLKIEREDEHGSTFCSLELALAPHQEREYTDALVIPFAEVQTASEYIRENPDETEDILLKIRASLNEFQAKGSVHQHKIKNIKDKRQRKALEDGLRPIDYVERSRRFVGHSNNVIDIKNINISNPDNLGIIYSELGIAELLNECRDRYPSLIHGDLHLRNVVVNKKGETILCDFETVGFGAPQIDQGRLYSHRDLEYDIDKQVELVKEDAKERGLDKEGDVSHYVRGYHAAVIYKTLEHMRYIVDNTHEDGRYNTAEAEVLIRNDLDKLREHTYRYFSKGTETEKLKEADRLVEAARQEFVFNNQD
ncbi:MAG: phosphotransferase [Candidatus Woesearchaeota archaeon]